jgi:hypothetical protein
MVQVVAHVQWAARDCSVLAAAALSPLVVHHLLVEYHCMVELAARVPPME